MSIFEKMFGRKKSPQEVTPKVEKDIDTQITELETEIQELEVLLEKRDTAGGPTAVKGFALERKKKELQGLKDKRALAWETTRHEEEKAGQR